MGMEDGEFQVGMGGGENPTTRSGTGMHRCVVVREVSWSTYSWRNLDKPAKGLSIIFFKSSSLFLIFLYISLVHLHFVFIPWAPVFLLSCADRDEHSWAIDGHFPTSLKWRANEPQGEGWTATKVWLGEYSMMVRFPAYDGMWKKHGFLWNTWFRRFQIINLTWKTSEFSGVARGDWIGLKLGKIYHEMIQTNQKHESIPRKSLQSIHEGF